MFKSYLIEGLSPIFPINTDGVVFHCPICNHYHKLALSDIIPGLKRRCNREPAVIVEL
ncbi:MAG: hypothetical protein SPE04_01285 [Prevotella sp.]|nr:hypothetical protein [Prevotella sp.]